MNEEEKTISYEEVSPEDQVVVNAKAGVNDEELAEIDRALDDNLRSIGELDLKLYGLTNQADGIDYVIAASCGVLSGIVDSFFFSGVPTAQAEAALVGEAKGAGKFGIDSLKNRKIRKKAEEEASPDGLFAAMQAKLAKKSTKKNVFAKVSQAVDEWFVKALQKVDAGKKLPGPLGTTMREFAALVGDGSSRRALERTVVAFTADAVSEYSTASNLAKQTASTSMCLALVRIFYAARKLLSIAKERHLKKFTEFKKEDLQAAFLPHNRTFSRMMSVASATFTTTDLVDAGLRSGGTPSGFFLHVNYIGVASFTVCLGRDVFQGVQRGIAEKQRILAIQDRLRLLGLKGKLKTENVWVDIQDTEASEKALMDFFLDAKKENEANHASISKDIEQVGDSLQNGDNAELKDKISKALDD